VAGVGEHLGYLAIPFEDSVNMADWDIPEVYMGV